MLWDSCKAAKSNSILADSNDVCVDRIIFMACSRTEPHGDLITFWPNVNAYYISLKKQGELFETTYRNTLYSVSEISTGQPAQISVQLQSTAHFKQEKQNLTIDQQVVGASLNSFISPRFWVQLQEQEKGEKEKHFFFPSMKESLWNHREKMFWQNTVYNLFKIPCMALYPECFNCENNMT